MSAASCPAYGPDGIRSLPYKHLALKIRHHGCIWRAYWPGGVPLCIDQESDPLLEAETAVGIRIAQLGLSSLAMAENRICLRVSIVDWLIICYTPFPESISASCDPMAGAIFRHRCFSGLIEGNLILSIFENGEDAPQRRCR